MQNPQHSTWQMLVVTTIPQTTRLTTLQKKNQHLQMQKYRQENHQQPQPQHKWIHHITHRPACSTTQWQSAKKLRQHGKIKQKTTETQTQTDKQYTVNISQCSKTTDQETETNITAAITQAQMEQEIQINKTQLLTAAEETITSETQTRENADNKAKHTLWFTDNQGKKNNTP